MSTAAAAPLVCPRESPVSRLRKGLVAALCLPWLVPNHYLPWVSFQADWLAALLGLLLCFTCLASRASRRFDVGPLACAAIGAAAVAPLQAALGLIHFAGDALIVAMYLIAFGLSVVVGRALSERKGNSHWVDWLAGGWVIGAGLSVWIALLQWLGAGGGLYIADMPPNGRPFGNVAQPNMLSTLCFLGLCGLAWLYEERRIHSLGFWTGALWMLLGMVMTQSRTGWLQVGLLVAWLTLITGRAHLRLTRRAAFGLGLLFIAISLSWPSICDALYLSASRSIAQQAQVGSRWLHWSILVDAIGREPLTGYGWNQVSAAQQQAALDHPFAGEYLEHSHNLVLDLMLWNGIPIGVILIGALIWWFQAHVRGCRDARCAWLLAAIGGVFAHAMLEYPLDYAYLLIPIGLAMGAVEALSSRSRPALSIARAAVLATSLCAAALLGGVTFEYMQVEADHRRLRFESARIGKTEADSGGQKLVLLTQLREFLRFGRMQAREGMSFAELDWMRKVSERFGHAPVLFRYALAAGLNGHPKVARDTLARLCTIHQPTRCDEGREAWIQLQQRYPSLRSIEAPPRR